MNTYLAKPSNPESLAKTAIENRPYVGTGVQPILEQLAETGITKYGMRRVMDQFHQGPGAHQSLQYGLQALMTLQTPTSLSSVTRFYNFLDHVAEVADIRDQFKEAGHGISWHNASIAYRVIGFAVGEFLDDVVDSFDKDMPEGRQLVARAVQILKACDKAQIDPKTYIQFNYTREIPEERDDS